MHRECAQKFQKYNKKCNICNSRIRINRLEPVSELTPGMKNELRRLNTMRVNVCRKNMYYYATWTKQIFPHVHMFFKKYNMKAQNLIITLRTILEDDRNRQNFEQHLMNNCFKQTEVNLHLDRLNELFHNYNVMDTKVQKVIVSNFKKRLEKF
jgi:hypothetical protein